MTVTQLNSKRGMSEAEWDTRVDLAARIAQHSPATATSPFTRQTCNAPRNNSQSRTRFMSAVR